METDEIKKVGSGGCGGNGIAGCPRCGKNYPEAYVYCPLCGQSLESFYHIKIIVGEQLTKQ